jgi:hypothetical protein
MGRILVASAIVAITHGCGERSAPTPTAETPAASASVSAPSTPALPEVSIDATTPPVLSDPTGTTFEAEPRDTDWAPATERALARRFDKLRGAKLEQAECRASQCRVVIAGSQGDVGQTIADLEGHRGLHGFAKNVVLAAPSKRADGTIELGMYVVFDR